jgi:hypothetical protein
MNVLVEPKHNFRSIANLKLSFVDDREVRLWHSAND